MTVLPIESSASLSPSTQTGMQIVPWLMSWGPVKAVVKRATAARTEDMVDRIIKDLPAGTKRICDIGCGPGQIGRALQAHGYDVVGVDRFDFKYYADFQTIVYDASTLPLADASFDVALLVTVLHHCHDPKQVLREAVRVAQHVLVIEDVGLNPLHMWATKVLDSLFNLEFFGHPHSNQTHDGWLRIFADLGLKSKRTMDKWSFGLMYQVSYLLRRQQPAVSAKPAKERDTLAA